MRFTIRCAALLASLLIASPLATANTESPLTFQTEDINAQPIDLEALRGQWVAVNFWATWCKPCRKEIPDLDSLHNERDDVTVIGLAYEDVGADAIRAFLEEVPASFPMALVDVYAPPEVFGVPRVLPTTVLVSPVGHNVHTFVGPVTRADIEAFIDDYD